MPFNPNQFATRLTVALVASAFVISAGCQQSIFKEPASTGLFGQKPSFKQLLENSTRTPSSTATTEQRLAALSDPQVGSQVDLQLNGDQSGLAQVDGSRPALISVSRDLTATNPAQSADATGSAKLAQSAPRASQSGKLIVRGQSPGFGFPDDSKVVQAGGTAGFQSESDSDENSVQQTTYQFPELDTPDRLRIPGNGLASPNVGSPNELNPLVQPYERGGNAGFPLNYADLDVYVAETQTGRINFGGAYNSDNGIVGQFTIDEKNFDITRLPRSFREILDGTAFRGAGQSFRLELAPGANLQRYLVSFTEPYLLGTDFSFSASAYLFDRAYFDWDEHRLGGRIAIGRRLTPNLSISSGLRMEDIKIDNPRVNTSTVLNDSLGSTNLFLGNVGLIRDTRDNTVQATEGTFLSATYSQAFGDFDYARGDLDFRTYRLMYERPDGSGRHTISYGTKLGFSGSSTPIFENYYAGGFSTLRGFDFRGAAPTDGGVRVGGEFQWLNSVEYMFPMTADDMIKGVVFCDFGTVEDGIELNSENFRVAPGFGFRVSMPGAGIGAPLAFDFAFPVSTADGDDEKIFSFYLGVLR
ncbi:MAG: outer membrane protein insertion porin family [Mariniblastus sp.]|jgi:outer membrane protein insertion porin family